MRYVISIDWLALFCYNQQSGEWCGISRETDTFDAAYPWQYERCDYGTRHFKHLTKVSMPNEEGGFDEFAEVQSEPCSSIHNKHAMIVRFVNRVLYRPDFWWLADKFLQDNHIEYRSISRVDICADFNDFATMSPLRLIEGFANKEFRHIGRGVGALYFDHGVSRDNRTKVSKYGVHYTGLSFGTHASDARVYLYNKSFELATQGKKPWIIDRWMKVGLDVRSVWRLEVSLKSKACTFHDKTMRQDVKVEKSTCEDDEHLSIVYHSFVKKLFAFIKNRDGITNITREPRIKLFDGSFWIERNVIRNVSASNRLDRIIIKALYTLADTYRGAEARSVDGYAETLANVIAESADLVDWMRDKSPTWEIKTHR